jgi:hypothetical protein
MLSRMELENRAHKRRIHNEARDKIHETANNIAKVPDTPNKSYDKKKILAVLSAIPPIALATALAVAHIALEYRKSKNLPYLGTHEYLDGNGMRYEIDEILEGRGIYDTINKNKNKILASAPIVILAATYLLAHAADAHTRSKGTRAENINKEYAELWDPNY